MSDPLTADIVIGDMHIGHKTAILYPYGLEDYKPNKAQKWLFKVWHDEFLPAVKELIKEADYVHGLLGGDMGDIDLRRKSEQYWTRDINVVRDNANTLLEPFIEMCDTVHVLKGTVSHTGQNSQVDEAIARNFDNVEKRDETNYAWYICNYRTPDRTLVNAQHYGKNKSKWGEENLINSLRDEIILERTKNSEPIPDIAYRHHWHWAGFTNLYKKPIVVQVPSWQLPYDYIAQIDPVGRTPIVGGVVSFYKKGKITVFPLNYTYKERIWVPKS